MQHVDLSADPETDMFGREDGKWGYSERPGGEWVIEPRFDDARDFHEGVGNVRNILMG